MARLGVAWVLGGVLIAAAIGVATLAQPATSTFELQRRDRLPPAGRFVSFAYQFLLHRPPDPQGLATYQTMFEQGGADTVVAALTASDEYRRLNPSATDAASSSPNVADVTARTLAAYDSGEDRPSEGSDVLGRIGFVLLLCASVLTLLWLERRSASDFVSHDSRIYVPARYITGLFAALAIMVWTSNNLLLASFAAGRFGYIEWLSQVTAAVSARGLTAIWTPYPQGVQLLVVGLQWVADQLAALLASDIWSSFTLFRFGYQVVFLVVPSIVSVAVVAAIGRRVSSETATLAALATAFSVGPFYYGVLTANVTDPLPVLCGLLALLCLGTGRPGLAGLMVGFGAALKLFPLLLLPVGLVYLPTWQTRTRFALATAAIVAVFFVPLALSNFDVFMSPTRWQTGRPPWESWYAFLNWTVSAPHDFRAPYFQDSAVGDAFGWVFWGITPRISALLTPVPGSPWRWENVVSLVGTLATLSLCLLARRRDSVLSLSRWALFALAAFLFWGIGWSPQYQLYLVPLIVLAVRPASVGLVAALLLEGLTLLEYPVLLPWAYFYGGSAVWLMWAALLARYAVLGWLCVYVVQREASLRPLRGLRVQLHVRRPAVTLGSALVLSAVLFAAAPANAQPISGNVPCDTARRAVAPPDLDSDVDWPVLGGRFFPEAGGFSMRDDDQARFWSEFQRLGGWPVLGYPATRRFNWHGSLSQVTQRAVLQWSPVSGQVEFANVLDLMHEQGLDDVLLTQQQIPPPADVDEAGLTYETIAARRLAWLDTRPAIKQKFCDAPGGGDPLLLWGLPTSMAVNVASPGTVYVVRTQRAAFQEWVDGAPWAAPGEVTVVLSGDLAKELQLLPSDALVPE